MIKRFGIDGKWILLVLLLGLRDCKFLLVGLIFYFRFFLFFVIEVILENIV